MIFVALLLAASPGWGRSAGGGLDAFVFSVVAQIPPPAPHRAPIAPWDDDTRLNTDLAAWHHLSPQDRLRNILRRYLGSPYRLNPLGDGQPPEPKPWWAFSLGVDCQTLVEQSLALSVAATSEDARARVLETRYDGHKPAFTQRLHLVEAQWLPALQRRGYIGDVVCPPVPSDGPGSGEKTLDRSDAGEKTSDADSVDATSHERDDAGNPTLCVRRPVTVHPQHSRFGGYERLLRQMGNAVPWGQHSIDYWPLAAIPAGLRGLDPDAGPWLVAWVHDMPSFAPHATQHVGILDGRWGGTQDASPPPASATKIGQPAVPSPAQAPSRFHLIHAAMKRGVVADEIGAYVAKRTKGAPVGGANPAFLGMAVFPLRLMPSPLPTAEP